MSFVSDSQSLGNSLGEREAPVGSENPDDPFNTQSDPLGIQDFELLEYVKISKQNNLNTKVKSINNTNKKIRNFEEYFNVKVNGTYKKNNENFTNHSSSDDDDDNRDSNSKNNNKNNNYNNNNNDNNDVDRDDSDDDDTRSALHDQVELNSNEIELPRFKPKYLQIMALLVNSFSRKINLIFLLFIFFYWFESKSVLSGLKVENKPHFYGNSTIFYLNINNTVKSPNEKYRQNISENLKLIKLNVGVEESRKAISKARRSRRHRRRKSQPDNINFSELELNDTNT